MRIGADRVTQEDLLARMIDTPRVTGVHLVKNDVGLTAGNAVNQRGSVAA